LFCIAFFVILGFTILSWVLPSYLGFYHPILGLPSYHEFCHSSLSFTTLGFLSQVLPYNFSLYHPVWGFTTLFRVLSPYHGFHLSISGFTQTNNLGLYSPILGFTVTFTILSFSYLRFFHPISRFLYNIPTSAANASVCRHTAVRCRRLCTVCRVYWCTICYITIH